MQEWIWSVGLAPALAEAEVPDAVPTKIGFRQTAGLRVRCAECGGGPATQSILMTSPWPESMYAFAPIWSSLARHFRVYAVDLPGFGGSERRDELMSPRAMGAFLVRLIEEWDLHDLHVVAPDVGTPAALFAAAQRPDLLASVVVGSAGAAVPLDLAGPLGEWVAAPDLDRYREMDPRAIVGAALDTIEGYAMPVEIREDYLDSYAGERFVESMRYARRYRDDLPDLARSLPAIATPVQIIAGRHDRVVPLANAEFLDARLPNSRLDILDAGHFVWEEAADEYGPIVLDWTLGGYHDPPRA